MEQFQSPAEFASEWFCPPQTPSLGSFPDGLMKNIEQSFCSIRLGARASQYDASLFAFWYHPDMVPQNMSEFLCPPCARLDFLCAPQCLLKYQKHAL